MTNVRITRWWFSDENGLRRESIVWVPTTDTNAPYVPSYNSRMKPAYMSDPVFTPGGINTNGSIIDPQQYYRPYDQALLAGASILTFEAAQAVEPPPPIPGMGGSDVLPWTQLQPIFVALPDGVVDITLGPGDTFYDAEADPPDEEG